MREKGNQMFSIQEKRGGEDIHISHNSPVFSFSIWPESIFYYSKLLLKLFEEDGGWFQAFLSISIRID